MPEKYDLKRMLQEIKEDDAAESRKYLKLSSDGVKKFVARKRKARERTQS